MATLSLRVEVSIADTDTGAVLLDERAGTYWQLNRSGAFMVRRLITGATEADLVSLLQEHYQVGHDRATADVSALTKRLRSAGLVREEP